MSHSVFRDLDSDKTSGNSSRSDIADNNLIIFINKDGDVQVDPDALQELVVNTNKQTKSTVSVIRVGSPTPSMEAESNKDSENSSEDDGDERDGDGDDEHGEQEIDDDEDNSNSSNSDESDGTNDSSDSDDTNKARRTTRKKKNKKKRKKKKKKVPGVSLMVEEFFNPVQAAKFAAEIMNIAGITDPRRLKADYERLRYIIQNDHCYTPFTIADATNDDKADEKTESSSRDTKPKPLVKIAGALATSTAKKSGRGSQSNGMDKDGAEKSRAKSVDDTNSSADDNGDSDEGDGDEETDFSDFTPSESDNDRDSDLDFSVHDSHSRRTKKIKKRKLKSEKAKKAEKALQHNKKRRQSTVESALSDDASTPGRKKSTPKVPKKNASASTKSSNTVTPNTSSTARATKTSNPQSSATKETPKESPKVAAKETSRTSSKETPRAASKETPRAASKETPKAASRETPKTTAQKDTSKIAVKEVPKVIAKETPKVSAKETSQGSNTKISTPAGTPKASGSKAIAQESNKIKADEPPTATLETIKTMPIVGAGNAKSMILIRHNPQDKSKFIPDNEKVTNDSNPSLVTLDTKNAVIVSGPLHREKVQVTSVRVVQNPKMQRITLPLSTSAKITPSPIITYVNRSLNKTTTLSPKLQLNQPLKLQSEQDKQLDLINSLVQEELNKPKGWSTIPVTSATGLTDVPMPSAIPNIVKMLKTPVLASTSQCKSHELLDIGSDTLNAALASNTFDSALAANNAMLPEDLLDTIDDDLMRDVAKLVDEDKNLRDVIDQEVLSQAKAAGMVSNTIISNQMMVPVTSTIQSPMVVEQPKLIVPQPQIINVQQPKYVVQHTKPIILNNLKPITGGTIGQANKVQYLTKIVTTPSTALKEPIKVKRSDGRIIILPPIEAPATRGAKRRAGSLSISDIQQAKVIITSGDASIKVSAPVANTTSIVAVATATATTTTAPISITTVAKTQQKASNDTTTPVTLRDRRSSVATKNSPQTTKLKRSLSISNPPQFDDLNDDDDEDDESDNSGNSEDDPHRLWCICQTPHNNRFMICCDRCLDWFHGKCVGITKSGGKEIEQRGAEWICPKCKDKQQPSIKNIFARQLNNSDSLANNAKAIEAGSSNVTKQTVSESLPTSRANCAVCGVKLTRPNTSCCSDECAHKHAHQSPKSNVTASVTDATTSQQSDALVATNNQKQTIKMVQLNEDAGDKRPPKLGQPLFRDKSNRVVVFEKGTHKFLTGKSAPEMARLNQWLKMHPNYEVLKPGTPQAIAFKAKQMQLKSLAQELQAKPLFSVSQPAKVQTTLRIEADKKIVIQNPLHKLPMKKVSVGITSPATPKLATTFARPESITKNPKLTASPAQKSGSTLVAKKRTEDLKSPLPTKASSSSGSSGKANERDQLRLNARKTMIAEIAARSKEITDTNVNRLTDSEIADFVSAVEDEMFAMFGNDTNVKYKTKYRSLMFNIKDRKNKTLFEKISNKIIAPKKLVRLSPEELASQELAKWRENENKHQLEMITKSELDMLALGKSYVLKTHKGEEVIQENSGIDSSLAVKEVVSALDVGSSSQAGGDASHTTKDRHDKHSNESSSKSSSSSKRDSDRSRKDRHDSKSSSSSSSRHKRKRSRDRHYSSHDRSHDAKREKRDGDRQRDKDRDKSKNRSSDSSRKDKKDYKSSSSSSSSTNSTATTHTVTTTSTSSSRGRFSASKESKSLETASISELPQNISKPEDNYISDALRKAQSAIDSALSSSTPSKSTESTESPAETRSAKPAKVYDFNSGPTLFTANIHLADVTTIRMKITHISGNTTGIDFSKRDVEICGRIQYDAVWSYLDQIRLSRESTFVLFSAEKESDKLAYNDLVNHFVKLNRMGVIKDHAKIIKDFYVMPLLPGKPAPNLIKIMSGIDFGTNHRGLLIGIIIRHKSPPAATSSSRHTIPFISHKASAQYAAKDAHYTPPSSPNVTPAVIQAVVKKTIKPIIVAMEEDEPYSPGGSDEDSLSSLPFMPVANKVADYTPTPTTNMNFAQDIAMQRKVAEVNRQIEAERQQILAMHLQNAVEIDEPYSPTSSVSPPINADLSGISLPPNLADILKTINPVPVVSSIVTSSNISQVSSQMTINPYNIGTPIDPSDEYIPTATTAMPLMTYTSSMPTQIVQPTAQPSKLAQLTEEELMRLVPDDF